MIYSAVEGHYDANENPQIFQPVNISIPNFQCFSSEDIKYKIDIEKFARKSS